MSSYRVNPSVADLAECVGFLSCVKVNFFLSLQSFLGMVLFQDSPIFKINHLPISSKKFPCSHRYCMMLLPPCFTAGMVYFFLPHTVFCMLAKFYILFHLSTNIFSTCLLCLLLPMANRKKVVLSLSLSL